MDSVAALGQDIERLWGAQSSPETALIMLAMAPVLLLLWRQLFLVPLLLAEAATTVALLWFGMPPLMVAAFLIAGNAVLAAILLAKSRRRSAKLELQLASAEEAIRELQIAEERRKAMMARDVVQQFPGSHKGRSSFEVTDSTGHG